MSDRAIRPAVAPGGSAASEKILFGVVAIVLTALTVLPVARVVGEALAGGWAGLSDALGGRAARLALGHSIVVSLWGAVVSGVLGGGFALLLGLTDIRRKPALSACFVLLMILPTQVTTLAWIALCGPSSPVLAPLGLAPAMGEPNPLFGAAGIALLLGIEHAPLVFIVLRAASRAIPRELVLAALASGAGPWRSLGRVVLPMLVPAFLTALGLAFVSSVGNFGTPALLGIPGRYSTLPTLIYQRMTSFGPSALGGAAALSMDLVLLALAGVAAEVLLGRDRGWRLQGARMQAPLFALRRWRGSAEVAGWVVVALLLALPLASLLGTALVGAYGQALSPATATLHNFRYILLEHPAMQRGLRNSFLLAGISGVVLAGFAMPACYFAVWRRSRLMALLLRGAELAYALPGAVLALACILVFIRPLPLVHVSLYGTLGILALAYLARFLTLAQRPVAAAFRQLDPRLEQAAQASGAGTMMRLVRVMIPLVLPAAAAGGLLVFLTAFNELTVSALLWSAGHETIGVVMFSLEQAGETTEAAAASCVSAAVVILIMAACSLLARRLPPGLLPWQA